ncbi:MAG: hypothetical protein WC712_02555 [Candidatus Brocadiia bacterium]
MNITAGPLTKTRRLPYNSKTLVIPGSAVTPDTAIATAFLPPPRQFYLYALRTVPLSPKDDFPDNTSFVPSQKEVQKNASPMSEREVGGCQVKWQVKAGDAVKFGQIMVRFSPIPGSGVVGTRAFRSPIDGIVEQVFERSFYILVREEVDYGKRAVEIQVGRALEARGWKLHRYLFVSEGSFVEKGQMIARRMVVGSPCASVQSPIAGSVDSVDLGTGIVVVRRDFEEVPTYAGFAGEVSAVRHGEIEMLGRGIRMQGVCGVGGESWGKLSVVSGPAQEITSARVNESHRGCIIAGGKGIGLEALQRAVTFGVKGVITGAADQLDLCEFLQRDFAVSATGQELAPFPVILTERFGRAEMNGEFHLHLSSCEGKWASINGTTRIRAGVVRPEILIFNDVQQPEPLSAAQ